MIRNQETIDVDAQGKALALGNTCATMWSFFVFYIIFSQYRLHIISCFPFFRAQMPHCID